MTSSVAEMTVVCDSDASDLDPASTFVIDEEFSDISADQVDQYFDMFANADIATGLPLPYYRIVWKRFAVSQHDDQIRLIHLAMLAARLRDRIEQTDPETVAGEGLPPKYRAMVSDVAQSCDVHTDCSPPGLSLRRVRTYLFALVGLLPFLADQFLSILLNVGSVRNDQRDVVFAPSIGRFDTMAPMLDSMPDDAYELVISPMTAAYHIHRDRFDDIEQFGAIPFSRFATLRTLFHECIFLFVEIPNELFQRREVERELRTEIETETGVDLQATVATAMVRTHRADTYRDYMYYFLTQSVCRDIQCSKLVVGSTAPFGKAVLSGAATCGVATFHLTHSETNAQAVVPPFGTRRFVSGEYTIDYLEDAQYITDMDAFVPTGRPHLESLYEQLQDKENTVEEYPDMIRVLVATQPHSDEVRRAFAETVLDGLDRIDAKTDIRFKTHPGEDPAFYRDLAEREGFSVVDANLQDELCNADIVLTVNSNVGLEAMMAGAACICLNPWAPFIRLMPYAHAPDVPCFTAEEEFMEFMINVSPESIDLLKTEQEQFVTERYRLEGGANDRIARYILES